MRVRSPIGALASEDSAVQISSFTSGVICTLSRIRIATIQSAAQARSAASSMRESGCNATLSGDPSVRPPPRSCQSPAMAIAAARIEPPKSKANTWAWG